MKKNRILKLVSEILEEIKWAKGTNDEIHTNATLNIIKEKVLEIRKIIENE